MSKPLEWWEQTQIQLLVEWTKTNAPKYCDLVDEMVRQSQSDPNAWRLFRQQMGEHANKRTTSTKNH